MSKREQARWSRDGGAGADGISYGIRDRVRFFRGLCSRAGLCVSEHIARGIVDIRRGPGGRASEHAAQREEPQAYCAPAS